MIFKHLELIKFSFLFFFVFNSCKNNKLIFEYVSEKKLNQNYDISIGHNFLLNKVSYSMILRSKEQRIQYIYHDNRGRISTIFFCDTSGNRIQRIAFYKNTSKIKYNGYIYNNKLNGLCYFYSRSGKINSIYDYKDNKITEILYWRKNKFKNIDSTYFPNEFFLVTAPRQLIRY